MNLYFSDSSYFDEILSVSEIKDLFRVYQKCTESLNNIQKKIVVFSSIVTFIIDFYLIIKNESENFYNTIISKKIDFAYSGENLSHELRGNTVEFAVDDERRSLEISITCDTAAAIKICSLIIKEFELLLHDFERDFSDYGFRVYYVIPKLKHEGKWTSEIESRQFTAYIPKLLPLLAGRNIYSNPEAFSREVIQNSIDAINVRKEHDVNFPEEGKILITIGMDKKTGLSFYDIEDNGSGMTKYILERYLTTLGLSYYSGVDYKALNPKYDPISQFGIGFLSCFMLGKHIEVRTKHYTASSGLFLDIPNYDGCFFIEEDKGKTGVGTSIRIWENPDLKTTDYSFDNTKIVEYIQKHILNISFDIYINNKLEIPKGSLWRNIFKYTQLFSVWHYVPLAKDKKSGTWVATNDYPDFKLDYGNYGIMIYKPDQDVYLPIKKEIVLLNNGILVPCIGKNERYLSDIGLCYFCVCANLPPETMELDVSRDNLKSFNDTIDWNSISCAFKKIRAEYCNKKTPYFLLQQRYCSEKYPDNFICFDFDADKEEIIIILKKENILGNATSINKFLNYISANKFNDKITKFPIPLEESRKKYGEFTTTILSDIYELITTISGDNATKHYSSDAKSKEYENSILDVLFSDTDSFSRKNNIIGNDILNIINKYKINTVNLANGIAAIANGNKYYYERIRPKMKSDITNTVKDKRYTAPENSRIHAENGISNIMLNQKSIPDQLELFFNRFLRRAYASLSRKNTLTLANIAITTCSAVYTLLDFTSVLCSYNMLENGVKIPINREQIEPAQTWFNQNTL